MPFEQVSRSLAFAAVKKAQAFQADQRPPMEIPKKRGRPELINLRLKELLDRAETELAKYDIAPIRWLNRKLVCCVFVNYSCFFSEVNFFDFLSQFLDSKIPFFLACF